ncbi:MAG: hypothetical protein AAF376_13895 [Pseudomonadota bacterium]
MTREIDQGLFLRLMQLSAPQRNDLLEYIGQSADLTDDVLCQAERNALAERQAMVSRKPRKEARA